MQLEDLMCKYGVLTCIASRFSHGFKEPVLDFTLSEARICLSKRRQSSQPTCVVVGGSSYPGRRLGSDAFVVLPKERGKVVMAR